LKLKYTKILNGKGRIMCYHYSGIEEMLLSDKMEFKANDLYEAKRNIPCRQK
jgi:hypothetical protein